MPSFSRYNQIFNFCRPLSTPYFAACVCTLFTIALCTPSSNVNCSAQCSRALSIKIAQCCAKGINMAQFGSVAQSWLNKASISFWLSAVIWHHNYMAHNTHIMAQCCASMAHAMLSDINMWLNDMYTCIRHQYGWALCIKMPLCCASCINMASIICIMHQ